MNSIVVVGGDERQNELSFILSREGYSCINLLKKEATESYRIREGDVLILPTPLTRNGTDIYSSDSSFNVKIYGFICGVKSSNVVFAGGIPKGICSYFNEKKTPYIDYLQCDELTEYNAYLTGLGALRLLKENTDESINGKKVLVTGFGKVAKYTAQTLRSAGCDVYVSARRKLQRTQAECMGYKTVDFGMLNSALSDFNFIFNTVPDNIFQPEVASNIKGIYIELASAPYGIDKKYFESNIESYIFGGSLPGRYYPRQSAEKLAEITIQYLKNRNGGD